MAGLDVCLEVVAKADPNAALGIQKFVYDKLSNKSSSSSLGVGALFLDPLADLIGAGIGKDPQGEGAATVRGKRSGPYKVDSWSRELVKNAELKLASNLFTCQIRIFGNSLQTVQTSKKALPAAPTNRLKTFKTLKKPQQYPMAVLRAPTRYVVRNSVLCRLWWAVSLCIVLFSWFFGLFSPLKFVSFELFSAGDLGFLVFVVSLAFCLFMAFRKRQPIVLSTQELSQIVGLPTAIEKLPVTLGKVPISRMQLDVEQTTEEGKSEKQTCDKEEEELLKSSTPHPESPTLVFENEQTSLDF
jgi:hypothetical protein